MKPGKIAAQCCHACLGAFKKAMRKCPNAVRAWKITGQAKVCVKVSKPVVRAPRRTHSSTCARNDAYMGEVSSVYR